MIGDCICGYCETADKFIALSHPLCRMTNAAIMEVLQAATAQLSTTSGNTMIMTLPSGKSIVRFLIPSVPVTPAGSVGRYSEGIDMSLAVAMSIALAGLSS